jgi:transcriptional regulator with XRE-family HTH domain
MGIGMTRQVISLYTTGQSTPDINTLLRMADFFGVSCDYLIGKSIYENQKIVDDLMNKLHALDGLDTKQKSSVLWSLGFVSERIKSMTEQQAKNTAIELVSQLLQTVANMLYFPVGKEMDLSTLGLLTSPHRDAINIINKLDEAMAQDVYNRLYPKPKRGKKAYKSRDGNEKEASNDGDH